MARSIALSFIFVLSLFAPSHLFAAPALRTPGPVAESLRTALVQAQLVLSEDKMQAQQLVEQARQSYQATLAPALSVAPTQKTQLEKGFAELLRALADNNAPAFAAARAQVWTALLNGSYQVVQRALNQNDWHTAQQWLAVREFRTATRFARPNADATLALAQVSRGATTAEIVLQTVHADLLDTYQARLGEALRDLDDAQRKGFAVRQAELAALAVGYFAILAPAYAEQRGEAQLQPAEQHFADLLEHTLARTDTQIDRQAVDELLHGFRAAPLSPAEQSRRAGQLLRYLALVPVEYSRGVVDGRVSKPLEIQEAITFQEGAQAALADLENLLSAADQDKTGQAIRLMAALRTQLTATNTGNVVAAPAEVETNVKQLTELFSTLIPAEWLKSSSTGDFDVITAMLDQMESAVRAHEYGLAESARLEAYAVMESGPEARLMVFAPEIKLRLEELFWNGQGQSKGLAYLIKTQAGLAEIHATRIALDRELQSAQSRLAQNSAPAAVLSNAAIIVFREGLEAVLILASLMGSMKQGESRRYRKPLWWGTALAFVATILTWFLAHGVLMALARYGEKLEAVVSLIAIGVLLLITNWFFHKMYWNDWIAAFHTRKQRLLSGEAGLLLGLTALGFTSVYREGFETVLFLQALILEAGVTIVLIGSALGLAATLLVGFITFRVQAHLPYKKMLIVTGILIGGVLLMMVGNTVHILQVIGWLPIHLIEGLTIPIGLGAWLGFYPTWEGIGLQLAAAIFVIGSYYWAEHLTHPKRSQRTISDRSLKLNKPAPLG